MAKCNKIRCKYLRGAYRRLLIVKLWFLRLMPMTIDRVQAEVELDKKIKELG